MENISTQCKQYGIETSEKLQMMNTNSFMKTLLRLKSPTSIDFTIQLMFLSLSSRFFTSLQQTMKSMQWAKKKWMFISTLEKYSLSLNVKSWFQAIWDLRKELLIVKTFLLTSQEKTIKILVWYSNLKTYWLDES